MPDLDQMVIVKVTADVSEFRSQMKSAGSELDQFGAKAKTVDATSGSLASTTKSGTSAWQSYAQALQQSYGLTDPLTRGQTSMIRSLEQQVAATKLSGSELSAYTALRKAGTTADTAAGQVIAALAQQHYQLSTGTKTASVAVKELEGDTISVREAMRGTKPLAEELGTSFAGFAGIGHAAGLGMAGFAAVIGGVLIAALENAADKARIAKGRLDELTGGAGGATFAKMKAGAEEAGVGIDTLSGAVETLVKAQRAAQASSGWTFSPGAGGAAAAAALGKGYDSAAAAAKTLDRAMQADGLNALAQKSALDSFATSLAKDAGLTKAAAQALETASPKALEELAKGFGYGATQLEQFYASLQRQPPALDAVFRAIAKVAPEIAALEIKPTVSQSIDRLKTSFEEMLEAASKGASGVGITELIKSISEEFAKSSHDGSAEAWGKSIADAAKEAVGFLQSVLNLQKESAAAAATTGLSNLYGDNKTPFPDVPVLRNVQVREGSPADALTGGAAGTVAWINSLNDLSVRFDQWRSSANLLAEDAAKAQAGTAGLDKSVAQLAAGSDSAAAEIAADANQIAGARNTAAGAAAASGDGISAPDMSSGANVGDNAQGGIYSIGSGGGTFPLRGTVHSGEIVAIIPSGQADKPLLDQLQSAIGSSPISIGAGGGHIGTSTSSIAAPASYAAANQSAALSAALAGQSPSAGVALSNDQVQSAIASVAALQAQNQAAQGAVAAATPSSVLAAAPAPPASAGAPVGSTMADAVKKAQALQNPQTAFSPSVGAGYAFVGGRVVPISGVSIPGSGADGGGSSGRGKGGGDLNFGGMSSKSDVGDVSLYSSSNLPGAASLSRVAAARASGVRGGAEGPVSTAGQMAKRIDMAGTSIAGAAGYRTLSDTQRALNLGSYGFVGPTLDQALQGYFQGPTLGMLDAGPSLFQLGLSGLMDASAYGTPDLSSFYDAFGGTFTPDYSGGVSTAGVDFGAGGGVDYSGGANTAGVDYGSFYDATGSGGDPYAATSFDAGDYASGGMFKVPGSGGRDSVRVNMRMSPGETGMVLPPGNGGPGQWMGGPSWWQNPQPAMPSDSAPAPRSIAPDAGAGDVNIAGHVIINTQGALGSPMSRAAIRRNMRSLRG